MFVAKSSGFLDSSAAKNWTLSNAKHSISLQRKRQQWLRLKASVFARNEYYQGWHEHILFVRKKHAIDVTSSICNFSQPYWDVCQKNCVMRVCVCVRITNPKHIQQLSGVLCYMPLPISTFWAIIPRAQRKPENIDMRMTVDLNKLFCKVEIKEYYMRMCVSVCVMCSSVARSLVCICLYIYVRAGGCALYLPLPDLCGWEDKW